MVNFHMQTLKIGLILVWLCGFIFISISFYATTQILPSSSSSSIKDQTNSLTSSTGPTVTIFTVVRPFSGSIGRKQTLAIRSWLGLSQDIRVVIFTQDPSGFSFADSLGPGSRVSVEPTIDFTFLGTPFFHSMVARAQASNSDISVLVDSETILLPDFFSTLSYVYKLDHDWLLIASSRNVSNFPFQLDVDGEHWVGDNGKKVGIKKDFLSHEQWEHCVDKKMIMAWNNGDIPLHNGVLPPFLYGKGFHTLWVINEALTSNVRFVFDASLTISSFFINNIYNDATIESRKWEKVGNSHLGAFYGSLFFREANYSNLIKLFKSDGHYHFGSTIDNTLYPLENPFGSKLSDLGVFRSSKHKKLVTCFDKIKPKINVVCSTKKELMSLEPLSFPFSLELLLSKRANKNKTIVLAIAGYSYKDMLMSWVCRLHVLNVSNFVVCALDDEIYDFSVLQDYVEAARTAAINQEIKRILTEVLLKVTDELFDEIATKVLEEDTLSVKVEHKSIGSSDMVPAIPTPKSCAKVLIPSKTKGDDTSRNSNSSSPGDVLGLGNYASDDDDDEVQNLSMNNSKPIENGTSQVDGNKFLEKESDVQNGNLESKTDHVTQEHRNDDSGVEKVSSDGKHQVLVEGVTVSANKSLPDDSQGENTNKKRSSSKDNNEEVEKALVVENNNNNNNNKNEDERHIKKAIKKDDRKDKIKDGDSGKRGDKIKEVERDRRRSRDKEDGRKRERSKDERSRHKRHDSTDTSSDDSRRRVHSKRRNSSPSPSPVRSRRQVSRSPPTKRSQHRHYKYETSRERKRSRSRSRRG